MVVPSEATLHFLELLPKRFVLSLYLEKALNCVVLVQSALNVLGLSFLGVIPNPVELI